MNIWTGLLFLEGAVADTSLARELAGEHPGEPHAAPGDRDDETAAARNAPSGSRWLIGTGQY